MDNTLNEKEILEIKMHKHKRQEYVDEGKLLIFDKGQYDTQLYGDGFRLKVVAMSEMDLTLIFLCSTSQYISFLFETIRGEILINNVQIKSKTGQGEYYVLFDNIEELKVF